MHACLLLHGPPCTGAAQLLAHQPQHLLFPFPGSGSPSPSPMPEEIGEAQVPVNWDTQKPGQPRSCFSDPIRASCPTTPPALVSTLAACGQQKAAWFPSSAAGLGTFPGGVQAGQVGLSGGSSPQFSATSRSCHFENGFTAACLLWAHFC